MMTPTARPLHDWRMVLPEVTRHGVILDDNGARVAAGHLRVQTTSRLWVCAAGRGHLRETREVSGADYRASLVAVTGVFSEHAIPV